jgi:hypothetical protein
MIKPDFGVLESRISDSIMRPEITRRDFLKIFGAAAIGFGFRDFPPGGDPVGKRMPSFSLGRAIYSLRYYELPSITSRELGYYITDTVFEILEERIGDPKPTHNPIWLRTKDGWLHSAYVQPVDERFNEPVTDIPKQGILAEVTVPYSQAWSISERGWKRVYRCYYRTTYWIHHVFTGFNDTVWYQIYDERAKDLFAVEASHLCPVSSAEIAPISPSVDNKRIEIDLTRQRMVAYEGSQPVYTTRIASGYFEGDTPIGEFRVERKQPTRHMASNLSGSEFDLPGVPWVCYISWTGVSFHGTYWHNNYGTPQSHGCINLTPEAAKWIYRWTDPIVPVDEDYVESDLGTLVNIYQS